MFYPTMLITIETHPSPYAALRATSSRGADIGKTTPCNIGFAKTGIRRLGKRFGNKECRADPTVWGCIRPADEPVPVDDWIEGETGDWTTLSAGLSESGGNGRKTRRGIWRNGWGNDGRRRLVILRYEVRSSEEIMKVRSLR